MTCEPFRLGDVTGIICRRGVRRPKCSVPGCSAPSEYQCDFPLTGRAKGRTCDKHLCCAHRCIQCVTTSAGEPVDYCPAHDTATKGK